MRSEAFRFAPHVRADSHPSSPSGPFTAAAVALLFLAGALFASWLPVRRAAKADPMIALSCE